MIFDKTEWDMTYKISKILIHTRLHIISTYLRQKANSSAEYLIQLIIDDVGNFGVVDVSEKRQEIILNYAIDAKKKLSLVTSNTHHEVQDLVDKIKLELELDNFIAKKFFVKNIERIPLDIKERIVNMI